MTRRSVLAGAIAAALSSRVSARDDVELVAKIRELNVDLGGRLGVYVVDTANGATLGFNENERFAMCSTFKALLASYVLSQVDTSKLSLEQRIAIQQQDMLSHAPFAESRVGIAVSLRELCAAIVEVSDNPAANLLLQLVGGPAALTRFLRDLGDRTTRLDRYELELNTNIPGDPRDTTTPRAMVETLRKLLLGEVLKVSSRELLTQWLVNSSTGLQRIRAGLPSGWRTGDKTGTGANGAVNDVAIVWPHNRPPILAAIYMSESSRPRAELEKGMPQSHG